MVFGLWFMVRGLGFRVAGSIWGLAFEIQEEEEEEEERDGEEGEDHKL